MLDGYTEREYAVMENIVIFRDWRTDFFESCKVVMLMLDYMWMF